MNEMKRLPAPDARPLLSPPERTHAKVPRGVLWGAGAALVLLLAWGIYGHWSKDQRAADAQAAQRDYKPHVRVAEAKRQDGPVKLTLPGTTLAFEQASIFARATGYIAERRVDIGSRVAKGDLLLRIAAPDLDAQLAQAAAQLGQMQAQVLQANASVDQARANVNLANRTNFRTSTLAGQGWETKQNADNSAANVTGSSASLETSLAGVKVAEANLKAQLATVQRLQELTAYENVAAPFDGVVTARNVDTGDLVSADAGGGTPMFVVQRDDVVRVQAYVPQSGAVGIQPGVAARVSVPELPGRSFDAQVARSAIALDPQSRTLLVQVDVPNAEHALHPGLYVDIAFDIPRTKPAVVIPSEAVLFDASGMHAAVVTDDGKLTMRKITIYHDFGTSVELSDGLSGGEKVALQPPVTVQDGQAVVVDQPKG